ncbi:hypothetical protein Ciccas_014061 [Cichlidogyrus casuarinus]|uniref:Uncharacterized protein n=1 Tax=Cichlidogyrus casuarinus TaxID=1844966 RepID=A0ABD2PJ32_9PLAT
MIKRFKTEDTDELTSADEAEEQQQSENKKEETRDVQVSVPHFKGKHIEVLQTLNLVMKEKGIENSRQKYMHLMQNIDYEILEMMNHTFEEAQKSENAFEYMIDTMDVEEKIGRITGIPSVSASV